LSGEYPFTELEQALKFAGDKTQAAKVQLVF
jgi:L-idonate 5-dehydrogenase